MLCVSGVYFRKVMTFFCGFAMKCELLMHLYLLFLFVWPPFPFPTPAPFSFITHVHPEVTLCSGRDIELKKTKNKNNSFFMVPFIVPYFVMNKGASSKSESKKEVKLLDRLRCV